MHIQIKNYKLLHYYHVMEECIVGLALKTDMVLAIRQHHVQITHNVFVINMRSIVNLFEEPVPILVLRHTQEKWLKLAKKKKLSVVVSEIFNSGRLIKAKINLALRKKNREKKSNIINYNLHSTDINDEWE